MTEIYVGLQRQPHSVCICGEAGVATVPSTYFFPLQEKFPKEKKNFERRE